MQQAGAPDSEFRIRSLMLTTFVPTLLFAIGQGAVIPAVPLFATHLGASIAVASLIVGLRGIGTALFDVPAGMLVDRFGERWTMVGGTVLLGLVAVGAAASRVPWQLAVFSVLMGNAWAIFLLARLSYIANVAPPAYRGRAISLLGGTNRIGNFIGPIIGGFAADAWGFGAVFFLQAVVAGAGALLLFIVVRENDAPTEVGHGSIYQRLGAVIYQHRRTFATAGVVAVAIQLLRSGRQVIIPLWALSIGLDASTIGIIIGLSSGIDMLMFYPVGIITDRWGRKFVAIPCLLIMALALAATPLAHSAIALVVVGMVGGFGNGLGSGITMTMGADFSPVIGRGEFLGVWRLVGDLGGIGGPLAIGAVTSAVSLGAGCVVVAGFGVAGALLMALAVPEPLHYHARRQASGPAPPS